MPTFLNSCDGLAVYGEKRISESGQIDGWLSELGLIGDLDIECTQRLISGKGYTMKTRKSILLLTLALTFSFVLAACGSSNQNTSDLECGPADAALYLP